MHKKLNNLLGEYYTQLINFRYPAIIKNVVKLINRGFNAEYSVCKVINKIIHSFLSIQDNYLQEEGKNII
ncbi:MAG: hypothetical protein LBM05_00310 [Endomicrobium sp.]|jgi:signal transduction protein with GAF and PtsI domain|nr:hypothetical protein [Endomicrobium sp.]